MKPLDKLFETMHLFKVYLLGILLTGSFVFILFQFVSPWMTDGQMKISTLGNIKLSLSMGAIFGLMFMLMVSMSRKSIKFWRYAESFEKLIDEATTKRELKDLYANEFKELKHLAQGRPHYGEVKRLYAKLETKHKYIQE